MQGTEARDPPWGQQPSEVTGSEGRMGQPREREKKCTGGPGRALISPQGSSRAQTGGPRPRPPEPMCGQSDPT